MLIVVGYTLIFVGSAGLLAGLAGLVDISFSYGLSSGIRLLGSLAIVGCVLNAIAYGILELRG